MPSQIKYAQLVYKYYVFILHKIFLLVRHNISMKKKLPNEQFRKLVEFINETRKNKSKKIYEDKEQKEIAFILRQVFEMTKDSDGKLSGDGTGLETSRRQNYGENRSSTKEFLTSIVDSREIIQAFDFSGKDEC